MLESGDPANVMYGDDARSVTESESLYDGDYVVDSEKESFVKSNDGSSSPV